MFNHPSIHPKSMFGPYLDSTHLFSRVGVFNLNLTGINWKEKKKLLSSPVIRREITCLPGDPEILTCSLYLNIYGTLFRTKKQERDRKPHRNLLSVLKNWLELFIISFVLNEQLFETSSRSFLLFISLDG